MKTFFSIATFLFINICTAQTFNKNELDFYEITIFKWSKDDFGNEQEIVIIINEKGNITYNGNENYMKISPDLINESFSKFIMFEKIQKRLANNDPPPAAAVPRNGEQIINISIVELKDYNLEKDFANNSQYSCQKKYNSLNKDYDFYKYLDSKIVKTLKRLLN